MELKKYDIPQAKEDVKTFQHFLVRLPIFAVISATVSVLFLMFGVPFAYFVFLALAGLSATASVVDAVFYFKAKKELKQLESEAKAEGKLEEPKAEKQVKTIAQKIEEKKQQVKQRKRDKETKEAMEDFQKGL